MSALIKGDSNDKRPPDESTALNLIKWITDKGIQGVPGLCSADKLAMEYQADSSYADDKQRIQSLINWETSKNFTSGFVTGLGGILTLPVAIPAALSASWVIQARMAAAIAKLSGHDLESDRVKSFVMACLLGSACKDVLKDAGIRVTNGFARAAIERVPGKVLIEINKKVGFRLITKAGEKGAVNLLKIAPVAGGVAAGLIDAGACRVVGKQATKLFFTDRNSEE
jgi:hypothetical protein